MGESVFCSSCVYFGWKQRRDFFGNVDNPIKVQYKNGYAVDSSNTSIPVCKHDPIKIESNVSNWYSQEDYNIILLDKPSILNKDNSCPYYSKLVRYNDIPRVDKQ